MTILTAGRWLWQRRGWGLRLLLLAALLAMVAPPPRLLVLGPPQTVATRHPLVCTHTRLTDEVEPWKVLHTLELVRQMGAPTIVEYFPWAYHEGAAGQFNWSHAEMRVDFAQNQGLAVIARLGGLVPAWARVEPGADPAGGDQIVDTFLPEARFADFGEYVFQFVSHFRGRVRAVIIWNEPNVTLEWGFRRVDPEAYTRLLRIAFERAKAADPQVLVLGGALAPTLEPEVSELALDDLLYLERMYAAGAGAFLDGLAAHAYGLKFPPEEPPAADALNFRRVELLRAIMVRYGDAAKPIYLTESGWNDSPRWTHAVRPLARVEYQLRAFQWAEANWPYVPAVCVWAFRYPAPQRSYGDYFTLVTPEFTLKPIYAAIQAWTQE
ncbi:MAG: beta-galactosidase [Anaerolineales bacterium]|nr:beta-galactosidase [Anaerolineales bacterium]